MRAMEPVCPLCGRDQTYEHEGKTYFRTILVEVQGVYDGGLYLLCGYDDCRHAYHRFPPGHYLHETAERFIRDRNLAARQARSNQLPSGGTRPDETQTDPECE